MSTIVPEGGDVDEMMRDLTIELQYSSQGQGKLTVILVISS